MTCVLAPYRQRRDTKLDDARELYFTDSMGASYNLMASSPLTRALNKQDRPAWTQAKDLHPKRDRRSPGIMPPAQQDGLTYSWYFGPSGTAVPSNPNILRSRRLNGTERCELPSLVKGSLARLGASSLPNLPAR